MAPKPTSSVRGEYIETETGNKISRRATILGPKHIVLAGKCVIQHDVVIHGDLVRSSGRSSTITSSSTSTTTTEQSSHQRTSSTSTNNTTGSTKSGQESTSIHLGRYVFVAPGCTLHPPSRVSSSSSSSSSLSSTGSSTGSSSSPSIGSSTTTYYPLRISDHVYIGPNTHVQAGEIRSHVWIGANCVLGNMCLIKENVKVLDGTVLPANSVWASGCVVAGRPGRVVGELGEGWGGGSSSSSSTTAAGAGAGAGARGVVDTSSNAAGSTAMGGLAVGDEGVGLRSRERWASVGNRR